MKSEKGGGDGWTLETLNALPEEGLSALVWLFDSVDKSLQWPSGVAFVVVAFLPKSQEAERPISLTSFV